MDERRHTRRQMMAGIAAAPIVAATLPTFEFDPDEADARYKNSQLHWALEDNAYLRMTLGVLVRAAANADDQQFYDGIRAAKLLDAPGPDYQMVKTERSRKIWLRNLAERKAAA
jgi:hypothetical protein